jgi:hypothetical protein
MGRADWDRQAEQEKQDRTAMIQGQNYQDRTSRARTTKTRQAEQQKKTTRILGQNNRTGLLGKDGLDRTVRSGQPEDDRQNTDRTRQAKWERQNRIGIADTHNGKSILEQAEWDRQNGTGRCDRQNGIDRMEQTEQNRQKTGRQ